MAGFRKVRFLIEPIAAALAYEASLDHDELVLVADFGAGTSDLTLMRLGPGRRGRQDRRGDVVASDGVTIGGDRFDAEIMRHKLLRYFGAGSSYQTFDGRMPIPNHILGKLLSWHEMSFIRERSTQQLIDRMLRDPPLSALRARRQDAVHDVEFIRLPAALAAELAGEDCREGHHNVAGVVGIEVRQVIHVVWLLGAGLAAIAGVTAGLLVQIRPQMGFDLLLPLFAAAILGGIGSVPGAMIAGLIVGFSEALAVQLVGAQWRAAVAFVILVAVLLLRPQGLFGRAE